MSLARLLCELEVDYAVEEFLRDRGLTLESDRQLLDDLRALKGETFVEIAERVLGTKDADGSQAFHILH